MKLLFILIAIIVILYAIAQSGILLPASIFVSGSVLVNPGDTIKLSLIGDDIQTEDLMYTWTAPTGQVHEVTLQSVNCHPNPDIGCTANIQATHYTGSETVHFTRHPTIEQFWYYQINDCYIDAIGPGDSNIGVVDCGLILMGGGPLPPNCPNTLVFDITLPYVLEDICVWQTCIEDPDLWYSYCVGRPVNDLALTQEDIDTLWPPPPAPYCGDTVCSGFETCSSCPSDCGTCPEPPPEEPQNILEQIVASIQGFIQGIIDFFRGLFI